MRDHAEIARRLESIIGDSLIDYFTVYLPVQLLVVDIIGLERRLMPAPSEFCLRAIDAGLGDSDDICGFLGLDAGYGVRILEELCNDDYTAKDAFGRYQLMRRGKELLVQEGEVNPSDRRIQVLWDPVQHAILDRTPVYTKHRIDQEGIVAPISNAFSQPSASELEVSELNKLRNFNTDGAETGPARFDILRVTGIKKSFGRYRPCLALVFKNQDGELALRIAINGSIDEDLTTACARIGLPKLIGIDRRIGTKSGTQAVQRRRKELRCSNVGDSNVSQLVLKRSTLQIKIDSFTRRLAEEYLEHLEVKLKESQAELVTVESQLDQLPLFPVCCHRVDYYLIEALNNATSSITITSTNPSSMKIDGEVLACFRSCLLRKVQINLYISDRIGNNDTIMATFEKLFKLGSMTVEFLKNEQRSVFEIEWDKKHLLFCNEPPLGGRPSPLTPREFAGYFVSDEKAVSTYQEKFLSFCSDDFLVKLRPVHQNVAGVQKQRQRTRGGKPVRPPSIP